MKNEAIQLSKLIIEILDKKAHRGTDDNSWLGFTNGNGIEIGVDIEKIIRKAKKIIKNESKKL